MLHNGRLLDTRENSTSPGQTGLLNGWGVFSTLRVADGVLFAFERHWERMKRDAAVLHVPFPSDPEGLRADLLRLVEANEAAHATLRVVVVRNHGGPYEGPAIDRDFDVIAFTTGLTDWPDAVSLALKKHARHAECEFAGTKMLSWSFNLTWNEQAHERGFDEVVLLNERGEVSECTSANLFSVHGSDVFTPPLSSGCLPGVTRALLLEQVRVPGLSIREKVLTPADLEAADGNFITSTTRDVLPVRRIETLQLRQDAAGVLSKLAEGLTSYRAEYVSQARHRAGARDLTSA